MGFLVLLVQKRELDSYIQLSFPPFISLSLDCREICGALCHVHHKQAINQSMAVVVIAHFSWCHNISKCYTVLFSSNCWEPFIKSMHAYTYSALNISPLIILICMKRCVYCLYHSNALFLSLSFILSILFSMRIETSSRRSMQC